MVLGDGKEGIITPAKSFSTISFDADDTLWDFNKVMRHALSFVLREIRLRHPSSAASLTVDRMIDVRNEVARDPHSKELTLEEIRKKAFEKTLRSIGHDDNPLATELNNIYLHHRFEDIKLYNDVLPSLTLLQERFTLGIVSNGNTYPEKCGLDGFFTFTVFGQDHGTLKPDPHIFRIALRQAKCSAEQMLHVGDSLESDVAGAQSAGICAVWLNRNNHKNSSNIAPDAEIRSLAQLPDFLNRD
jgi:putative hydrolase of the HAD superfamily